MTRMKQTHTDDAHGPAGRIARMFVGSKLTPLMVIASVLLGLAAVLLLPREEEPQIKVPLVDVMVSMPGAGAKEIEERVTRPMEKLLWEIPGVEYIYSTSREGSSLAIVRFKVGEEIERSLVKLNQKLQGNYDRIPHGVSFPLVKPKSIDDVPILCLTFHGTNYDHYTLRRLAAQVDDAVKQVPQVAETTVIGGARRQVRVQLDPTRLASRRLTPAGIVPMITQANRQYVAGSLIAHDADIIVETGAFLKNAADVGMVVAGVFSGQPVYLRDVAEIVDGAEEPAQYVLFGRGAAEGGGGVEPAVTISIAKRPGANAVAVAHHVLKKIEALRGVAIPNDVGIAVTRDYGETAAEKSNELLFHMAIAVVGVSLLILFMLGWRESVVVALAIPSTLALTLLVFYLYGYTLNRITLFALIFSIGILVDDAIVVIENIVRHMRLPSNAGRPLAAVAVEAVSEVGNPTILATVAVIAAVLPMATVGGLMGPYMRPIPVGSSAAMLFSLLVAFIVTPWASVRMLRGRGGKCVGAPVRQCVSEDAGTHPSVPSQEGMGEDALTRLYRSVMVPLIGHRGWRTAFLAGVTALLLVALGLVGIGWVKVKMLPFDNKSEFQVILNMPEGSPLERTTAACREMAGIIAQAPEVRDYQIYAGVASPFNFNGLVRHYFLRNGNNVADIQVNLAGKGRRPAKSHEIAKRLRPAVAAVALRYGARVAVAEVPPGPPVLQTLVAEIYGPTEARRLELARAVRDIFNKTPGVVDVDWYVEADQAKSRVVIDKEKAALHGISAETISHTLRIATEGESVDLVHMPREKEDVDILLELPRALRTVPDDLLAVRVRSGDANALPEPGMDESIPLVPLRELVTVEQTTIDKSIYHKNLMPVTYVTADVAGTIESPVYAILKMNKALQRLDMRAMGNAAPRIQLYNAALPANDLQLAMKWDGEWQITIEVFRDLGLAFIAVLILIYLLMVGWFKSFVTPVVIMMAIPFSLVGILPAHGMLGAFFTATSMIGFMAGAGIVVRNSIILVDFIEQRLREGMPLAEAVVDAGAVRFRPMLLTAMAVVAGATVILFDPIFQGLAISLMAGETASLLLSRMAVPVLYYIVAVRKTAPPVATRAQPVLLAF